MEAAMRIRRKEGIQSCHLQKLEKAAVLNSELHSGIGRSTHQSQGRTVRFGRLGVIALRMLGARKPPKAGFPTSCRPEVHCFALSGGQERKAGGEARDDERFCFVKHCRHPHVTRITKPQRSWRYLNLLPSGSKSNTFAASNLTRILLALNVMASELPCNCRVTETPERVRA